MSPHHVKLQTILTQHSNNTNSTFDQYALILTIDFNLGVNNMGELEHNMCYSPFEGKFPEKNF